jgi:hypothetical protein
MDPVILVIVSLLGAGVWRLVRAGRRVGPGAPAVRDDVPARLLGWAAGLLAAERAEWGQAMAGELDQIGGRAERWRFAAGCVSAALLLPPWGRAGAAVAAFIAGAAGCTGLFGYALIRYPGGGGAGTWLFLAFLLAILAGYILAGSVLVRRPGVAGPGLVGGLVVAAPWLVLVVIMRPMASPLAPLLLGVVVPLAVGAGGTWRGGSAAFGRRTALLAGLSAALGLFLIQAGVLVATGGRPYDPGQIREAHLSGSRDVTAYVVGDGFGRATMLLLLIPLLTAMVGWAGAALAARIRRA